MSSRYDRLLSLSSFSAYDLKTLQSKKVLIIGVGGVGQHIATYLITNGIEHLTIVDYDVVEISNLNRQILLTEKDVGKPKVHILKRALLERNKDARVIAINSKLTKRNAKDIITSEYDIVVDALDNWKGKFVISDACHAQNIPFLHVGVDGMSGQYCIFKDKSLRDVLPHDVIKEERDGVIGSVVGSVAAMSTVLMINYLLGSTKSDQLYSIDLITSSIKSASFNDF